MDVSRWKRIDELVDAAMSLPESERAAFIESQTTDEPELGRDVCRLLEAQSDSVAFLEYSAFRHAASSFSNAETLVVPRNFIGKRIETYKIEKLLGAGGMGEVYLAFDEKLKRHVALKILPAEFGARDERVKRFELEAMAISSLNHPNIVTIYDVGEFEGINYIATEFVEGKTLKDLQGGRFKLRNILTNSIQICDALSAAHNAGIIHRDMKPENVMIRTDGYAKILDFGLAKLTQLHDELLRDMAKTGKGVMIGTPAYMSPAQLSDDKVDHRTDLWSAGVVLYEFLTGINPFRRNNRQETFQAILSYSPPPPSKYVPSIPPELDRILLRLLEKDPTMGYQSATDLRSDLKKIKYEIDLSESGASTRNGTSGMILRAIVRRPWYAYAGIASLLLMISAVSTYILVARSGGQTSEPDWSRAASIQLTNESGTEYFPQLSPDGNSVVFAAEGDGQFDILILSLTGGSRRNLTADSSFDNTQPAFSPDGQTIAFRSEREPAGIYLMDVTGENIRYLSDLGYHPSWSPDGRQIVVSTFGRDQPTARESIPQALFVIDVKNGERRKLIDAEGTFPAWSPNGHRIAYWYFTGVYGRRKIATVPAKGGEPVVVSDEFSDSNWNPVWAPDGRYLYFVSSQGGSSSFWRVAIDELTGEVFGSPELVRTPATHSRHLTFSRDGRRMVYVRTENRANIRGVDFDLAQLKPVGDPYWITQGDREIARAELSPDGSRFVMRLIRRTQDDIVTVSRDGKDWRDVTNDEPFDRYVRWSPDGKRLVFTSDREGVGHVWLCNVDGSWMMQFSDGNDHEWPPGPSTWSPDGSRIAILEKDRTKIFDSSMPAVAQQPFVLPSTSQVDWLIPWDWSPDGRMLLGVLSIGREKHVGYYSFENGDYHSVLRNVSFLPAWLPDSRHFIFSRGSSIQIADIRTSEVKELLSDPQVEVRTPFLSKDGKLLYYTGVNFESDIWMLELPDEDGS